MNGLDDFVFVSVNVIGIYSAESLVFVVGKPTIVLLIRQVARFWETKTAQNEP